MPFRKQYSGYFMILIFIFFDTDTEHKTKYNRSNLTLPSVVTKMKMDSLPSESDNIPVLYKVALVVF